MIRSPHLVHRFRAPTACCVALLLGCSRPVKSTADSSPESGAAHATAAANSTDPAQVPAVPPPTTASAQTLQQSLSVTQLVEDDTIRAGARITLRGVIGDLSLCPDCFEVDGESVCGEPCIEYAVLQASASETTPHVVLTTDGPLSPWFEAGKAYLVLGTVTRRGATKEPTTAEVELQRRWLLP